MFHVDPTGQTLQGNTPPVSTSPSATPPGGAPTGAAAGSRRRRVLVVTMPVAATIAAAVAGCTSSAGSPGNPPPATVTDTVTHGAGQGGHTRGGGGGGPSRPSSDSSPIGGSTTSTGLPGGGTTPAGPADCKESQLKASIDPRPVQGSSTKAHGDYAVIVDFQNTSSEPCVMHGYPGAALVGLSGKQAVEATRTIRGRLLGLPVGQSTEPTVTLQPGAYASAGLEGVDQQEHGAAQAGCDATYPSILVTPPNTKTAVPFDVRWPVCFSFTVHPSNIEKNPPAQ